MIDIFSDIAEAIEHKSEIERNQILQAISGSYASAGLSILIRDQGSGGITKYAKLINDQTDTAQKMADGISDNLQGEINRLNSVTESFAITAMDPELSALRETVKDIADIVRGLEKFAIDNPNLVSWISVSYTHLTLPTTPYV